MARADEGAYSENYRPDEEKGGFGNVHNLPWTQTVDNVVTDKTNWDLFNEEGAEEVYGNTGGGDLTGVGFNTYPGGHNEQADFNSGANPK